MWDAFPFAQGRGRRPTPSRSVVRAERGMVASSQPLASLTGVEVLKKGGNAVDAAVAMAAVLSVTEPMMTGLGGDLFALVYWAETGQIRGLNASGRAPLSLGLEHFRERGLAEVPELGMESITVPGAFCGWTTLLEAYGTAGLAELLSPAVEYAGRGFPVMEKTAEDWADAETKLKQTSPAGYLPGGRAPRAGEIFRQPNLAQTLRLLGSGGRAAFYEGALARGMADFFQKHGGFVTLRDLSAHESEWVEPISTDYRGHTLHECPPNGQGLTALLILNILGGFDLAALSRQPDAYFHVLIEATKLAFADRDRHVADPSHAEIPLASLLSKEYADARRALINMDRILDPPATTVRGGETTYLAVVDKDRNAVSLINSLYDSFGSCVVDPVSGIIFQNRSTGFTLEEGHPNCYAPGKRPLHTIIPAMVTKGTELLMSYGVMGGDLQPQGHAQVLVNLVDFGMGLQEALDAPRVMWMGGNDVAFDDAVPQAVVERLAERGHRRVARATYLGGAQAVMIDTTGGTLMGASDPRKDGLALGY